MWGVFIGVPVLSTDRLLLGCVIGLPSGSRTGTKRGNKTTFGAGASEEDSMPRCKVKHAKGGAVPPAAMAVSSAQLNDAGLQTKTASPHRLHCYFSNISHCTASPQWCICVR